MHTTVLHYWFEEIDSKMWWVADPAFDEQIRTRFGDLLHRAAQAELHAWRSEPKGRLAEIMVLDQFSRNVYRNTAAAFSQDSMALVLAQEAVRLGELTRLNPVERSFLLLPFMHSESRAIHVWAESLYREHAPASNYEFERKHKVIIDRFGRYPHRNRILGRVSTVEELAFLEQPGSSF